MIPIAGTPNGWSYVSRKPLILKGSPEGQFPFELPRHLVQASVKSGCWIPLIGREGPLGALNLFSCRAMAFVDEDLDDLAQLASQVAVALDNALTFQRMADLNARLEKENSISKTSCELTRSLRKSSAVVRR